MISCSEDFIQALRSPMKQLFLQIQFFDSQMNLITTFNEDVSKYQNFHGGNAPNHFSNYGTMRKMSQKRLGAISVDYTRAIRRSFSFGMDNSTNDFDWGPTSPVWISNRAKIFFGLRLANGNIEYIPQGVYVITAPTDAHNPKDGKNVYINGQDKAYLMSGTLGKFVNETTVQGGTLVTTAIKAIAGQVGETMFNFDNVTTVIPYDTTFQGTDTRWTAIQQFATLAQCIVYYDVNGYLRLEESVIDYSLEPPVWSYEYNNPTEIFYAGNVRAFNQKNLANYIQVVGGSAQTGTVNYDLVIDNSVPYTLSQTIADLSQWQAGTFSNTQAIELPNSAPSSGQLQLAQVGTDFSLFEGTQSTLTTGTQTGLTFVTTDTVDVDPVGNLSLTTDYAIQFSGANTNTTAGYNAFYYQNIYNTAIPIETGYQLAFDCYLDGPEIMSGIDGTLSGGSNLRSSTIVDQNGLSIAPATNLASYAKDEWYHRVFSLNSIAGQSITSMQIAFEGDTSGTYTSYFRNIHILNSAGQIVNIIYDASVAPTYVVPQISPSPNGGASSQGGVDDYSGLTLNSITVASSLTGTRVEPVMNLSSVGTLASSSLSWVGNLTSDQGVTVQIRTSTNSGSTWSAWQTITSGSAIPGTTAGQSMSGFQIQLQEILTTTTPTTVITLGQIQITANSEFLLSGTFTSNQFSITTTSCNPVNNTTQINWEDTLPTASVSMSVSLNVSTNNGVSWSGWQTVTSGENITQVTNANDISLCLFQFKVSMSTTDPTQSPVLTSLTIQSNAPIFQNSPYAIQEIGTILYQWNKGKADPLITEPYQAKWRAKYLLLNTLGFSEDLTMEVAPNFILDAGDIIQVTDDQNSVSGNFRITAFELPLIPQLVEISASKFVPIINDWNAI